MQQKPRRSIAHAFQGVNLVHCAPVSLCSVAGGCWRQSQRHTASFSSCVVLGVLDPPLVQKQSQTRDQKILARTVLRLGFVSRR